MTEYERGFAAGVEAAQARVGRLMKMLAPCPRCQKGDHSAHGTKITPRGCLWCRCGHLADCGCGGCEDLRAALSTPAPEGGDRCPTCLQMPDAYQKGIEDGARGQYRRGVEDAARVIIGLRTLARDASDLDVLEMAANRVGALALAPPATEGATKEDK